MQSVVFDKVNKEQLSAIIKMLVELQRKYKAAPEDDWRSDLAWDAVEEALWALDIGIREMAETDQHPPKSRPELKRQRLAV